MFSTTSFTIDGLLVHTKKGNYMTYSIISGSAILTF